MNIKQIKKYVLDNKIEMFSSMNFEQDFLRHIPNKIKQKYLEYLVSNIELLAAIEENENIKKFLYFLISRESLDLVKKWKTK